MLGCNAITSNPKIKPASPLLNRDREAISTCARVALPYQGLAYTSAVA